MSEPMHPSDALSGVDGTQLPEPLPTLSDPLAGSGRDTWRDAPELPPFVLPPIPDASVMREAIAAALGLDVGLDVGLDEGADAGPADQDPAAAPPAAPQATGQPNAANVNASNINVGGPPAVGAPTGGPPPPTDGGDRASPRQPPVAAPIPTTPPPQRRTAGLGYRPPMAGASRKPGSPAGFRRRIRREDVGLPPRSRSDGGATAVFIVMLIIVGLLVYFIVTGFLQWISSFFQ